jgi:poly-beta-1,6-N-acetyl-D-glucosamine biosynthesis protein PgaD
MIKLKPQDKWPPLVGTDNIPALILIRDTALTLCAWLMFAYLLRKPILLILDYLRYPMLELTASSAPDWNRLWIQLQPYALYIGWLMVWIMFWGMVRRKTLSASAPKPQPPALTTEEHASALNLNAQNLRVWQGSRNQIVHFDEKGNITKVTVGPML